MTPIDDLSFRLAGIDHWVDPPTLRMPPAFRAGPTRVSLEEYASLYCEARTAEGHDHMDVPSVVQWIRDVLSDEEERRLDEAWEAEEAERERWADIRMDELREEGRWP